MRNMDNPPRMTAIRGELKRREVQWGERMGSNGIGLLEFFRRSRFAV